MLIRYGDKFLFLVDEGIFLRDVKYSLMGVSSNSLTSFFLFSSE